MTDWSDLSDPMCNICSVVSVVSINFTRYSRSSLSHSLINKATHLAHLLHSLLIHAKLFPCSIDVPETSRIARNRHVGALPTAHNSQRYHTTDSKSIDFFYMFLGIFDIPSVKNLFWMSKILIMIFSVGTCRYSP